ncbi:MAG: HAD hydrolase family protein [Armatimonadetes bacterium]|nr:HAD hydrolase family protein [Armatimonadota bacterium]
MDLSHIKLIALDFDGTLIEPGYVIRAEAVAALRAAADAGVRTATASGRPEDNQRLILEQNGLGAATGIPHALTCDERTVWLLDGDGYRPLAEWNDQVDREWRRLEPLASGLLAEARDDCLRRGVVAEPHVTGGDVFRRGIVDLRFPSVELCAGHGPWLAARVAAVTDELRVTWNWQLLQIILACAGKGNTLAALARAWGLQPREVLAVGDRNNDTSMLDGSAGLTPAAVANAIPEIVDLVRRGGGYVAEGELGAGVAEIVGAVLAARRTPW